MGGVAITIVGAGVTHATASQSGSSIDEVRYTRTKVWNHTVTKDVSSKRKKFLFFFTIWKKQKATTFKKGARDDIIDL